MSVKRRQLLTEGKPFQWKLQFREGGRGEVVAITAAEHGNQVIFEFYAARGDDDPSLAELGMDDDRQPAAVTRWRLLYREAVEFAHYLRTTVKDDVYDRRRTKVRFVLTRDVEFILTMNRTDIDQFIRVMNEVLEVSKPASTLAIATR